MVLHQRYKGNLAGSNDWVGGAEQCLGSLECRRRALLQGPSSDSLLGGKEMIKGAKSMWTRVLILPSDIFPILCSYPFIFLLQKTQA